MAGMAMINPARRIWMDLPGCPVEQGVGPPDLGGVGLQLVLLGRLLEHGELLSDVRCGQLLEAIVGPVGGCKGRRRDEFILRNDGIK